MTAASLMSSSEGASPLSLPSSPHDQAKNDKKLKKK